MGVAQTAATAPRGHHLLFVADEVGDEVVGGEVADDSAGRNVKLQVLARLAVLPGSCAPAAGLGLEVVLEAVVAKHRLARVDAQVHAAAAAAVTAVWSAARDVRLAPEGRCTVAAVACADGDRHLVEKCHSF